METLKFDSFEKAGAENLEYPTNEILRIEDMKSISIKNHEMFQGMWDH